MKQVIIVFVTLVWMYFFTTCDNREENWQLEDIFSGFTLTDPGDSIIFHKANQFNYSDTVKVNLCDTFRYSIAHNTECKFALRYNTSVAKCAINQSKQLLTFTGLTKGSTSLSVDITDPWNQTKTVTINLDCLDNLPPVAVDNVTVKATTSGYHEVTINASTSYDQDARLGGKIILYEYTIRGLVTKATSSKPVYKYTISTAGTYIIDVRVQDNDSRWCDYFSTTTITI